MARFFCNVNLDDLVNSRAITTYWLVAMFLIAIKIKKTTGQLLTCLETQVC